MPPSNLLSTAACSFLCIYRQSQLKLDGRIGGVRVIAHLPAVASMPWVLFHLRRPRLHLWATNLDFKFVCQVEQDDVTCWRRHVARDLICSRFSFLSFALARLHNMLPMMNTFAALNLFYCLFFASCFESRECFSFSQCIFTVSLLCFSL